MQVGGNRVFYGYRRRNGKRRIDSRPAGQSRREVGNFRATKGRRTHIHKCARSRNVAAPHCGKNGPTSANTTQRQTGTKGRLEDLRTQHRSPIAEDPVHSLYTSRGTPCNEDEWIVVAEGIAHTAASLNAGAGLYNDQGRAVDETGSRSGYIISTSTFKALTHKQRVAFCEYMVRIRRNECEWDLYDVENLVKIVSGWDTLTILE